MLAKAEPGPTSNVWKLIGIKVSNGKGAGEWQDIKDYPYPEIFSHISNEIGQLPLEVYTEQLRDKGKGTTASRVEKIGKTSYTYLFYTDVVS